MRYYETTYVLSSDLSPEEKDNLKSRFRNVIQKNGKIIKEDEWGRRRLAYPINHKDFGYYVYLFYEANEQCVKKLEQEMNLQADVLRYLSVKIDDPTPYLPKEEQNKEIGE